MRSFFDFILVDLHHGLYVCLVFLAALGAVRYVQATLGEWLGFEIRLPQNDWKRMALVGGGLGLSAELLDIVVSNIHLPLRSAIAFFAAYASILCIGPKIDPRYARPFGRNVWVLLALTLLFVVADILAHPNALIRQVIFLSSLADMAALLIRFPLPKFVRKPIRKPKSPVWLKTQKLFAKGNSKQAGNHETPLAEIGIVVDSIELDVK